MWPSPGVNETIHIWLRLTYGNQAKLEQIKLIYSITISLVISFSSLFRGSMLLLQL